MLSNVVLLLSATQNIDQFNELKIICIKVKVLVLQTENLECVGMVVYKTYNRKQRVIGKIKKGRVSNDTPLTPTLKREIKILNWLLADRDWK